jgi:hypothetical protein
MNKILYRIKATELVAGKTYTVHFKSGQITNALFCGFAPNGCHSWRIHSEKIFETPLEVYKDRPLLLGGNEDIDHLIYLLSRSYNRNRVNPPVENQLVEHIIKEWEVDELVALQAVITKHLTKEVANAV